MNLLIALCGGFMLTAAGAVLPPLIQLSRGEPVTAVAIVWLVSMTVTGIWVTFLAIRGATR